MIDSLVKMFYFRNDWTSRKICHYCRKRYDSNYLSQCWRECRVNLKSQDTVLDSSYSDTVDCNQELTVGAMAKISDLELADNLSNERDDEGRSNWDEGRWNWRYF